MCPLLLRYFLWVLVAASCSPTPSFAYNLLGPWWHSHELEFTTPLEPHKPPSEYQAAFLEAVKRWNKVSGITITVIDGTGDLCNNLDNINVWGLDDTHCGERWDNYLAFAHWYWGADNNFRGCDIVVNANIEWEVHDSLYGGNDLTRTLVHEIGHCIGLRHEPEEESVMQPAYSFDWFVPQPDDIAGAQAMYGPPPPPPPPVPIRWITPILELVI